MELNLSSVVLFKTNMGSFCGFFYYRVVYEKYIYIVFPAFIESLFALNQSLISFRSSFAILNRVLKFLFE